VSALEAWTASTADLNWPLLVKVATALVAPELAPFGQGKAVNATEDLCALALSRHVFMSVRVA
jgi:hypothetical protein